MQILVDNVHPAPDPARIVERIVDLAEAFAVKGRVARTAAGSVPAGCVCPARTAPGFAEAGPAHDAVSCTSVTGARIPPLSIRRHRIRRTASGIFQPQSILLPTPT
ncbi:hypothetical protein [Burkholderia anthina]|uniref:hypothetical protein n=1 Tax=Burkholderia anthina TaxID=179879 RepID=UPI00158C51BE|nr:hypothetical protein [Burkholderia anthina]